MKHLGIDLPIVQGPMGGGNSTVDLVATVSNGGGLGSFGAHHLSPDEIRSLTASLRDHTDRPFALNLWVSNQDPELPDWQRGIESMRPYFEELGLTVPAPPSSVGHSFESQVEALIEAGPPIFSFIFGVPSRAVMSACKERGILTLGTATTADEAQALESAGVDAVVASGQEAGGHRGSFLRPAEESLTSTMALVPQVVDRVSVPVIAAGGIVDARGVRAALALGAAGAQLGTAFLACEESGAHPVHRAMLWSDHHTALTRVFSGRLARSLVNRLMQEMKSPLPYPAQSWLTGQLRGAALQAGRSDLVSLWAGQGAPLLRHRSAAELLRSLIP